MLYGLFIACRKSQPHTLQPYSPPTTNHQPLFLRLHSGQVAGHWLLIFAGAALVDLVERFRAWRCKRTV